MAELNQPQGKLRESIFSLPNGEVLIRWPEPLTAADVAEVEDFIAIWLAAIKRRALELNWVERCERIALSNSHEGCEVAEQIIKQIRDEFYYPNPET